MSEENKNPETPKNDAPKCDHEKKCHDMQAMLFLQDVAIHGAKRQIDKLTADCKRISQERYAIGKHRDELLEQVSVLERERNENRNALYAQTNLKDRYRRSSSVYGFLAFVNAIIWALIVGIKFCTYLWK